MTLAGKQAVRKAFENTSGLSWDSVRNEYISTRVEALFNPFSVQDIDAGGLALDLVSRAYLQGLRDAPQSGDATRAARAECAHREARYTVRLMAMFDRDVNPEWVTQVERAHVQSSIQAAYRAGCDEGRLPIGSVI